MKTNLSKLEHNFFPKLRKQQIEVAYLPPQTIGFFNVYYHRFIPWLKIAPWRIIFAWSIAGTVALRVLLGPWFVKLASFLQRGF